MELSFLFERFLDVLFPPICVSCGVRGAWWCMRCRDGIERVRAPLMPPAGVDRLNVLGYYHDPLLRSVIHAVKFRGVTAVRDDLAMAMKTRCVHIAPFAVQHLPAAPRRVRERGFDQALMLRDILCALVPGAVPCDALIRLPGTGIAQASVTDPRLRALNARGEFCLRADVELPPRILLVDDVVTTGATMSEAARMLREHGVASVDGFALALGA